MFTKRAPNDFLWQGGKVFTTFKNTKQELVKMEEKLPVKLIYKKSLFVELVRLNNNFLYSMRNQENSHYQVYAFKDTEKLRQDIAMLTGHEYDENF